MAPDHRHGERGVYPVHKVISVQIKADDVVEKGFKTLLDPAGNQMKVLVKGGVTVLAAGHLGGDET